MDAQAGSIVGQRIGNQAGAEIGSADADADDIGDPGIAQVRDQRRHPHACRARLGGGIACHARAREVAAQRGVQGGATFGDIHDVAVEEATKRSRQIRGFGEREQRVERLAIVALTREARVERAAAQREVAGTMGIIRDQRGQRQMLEAPRMRAECFVAR